jgi:hypothetical protein
MAMAKNNFQFKTEALALIAVKILFKIAFNPFRVLNPERVAI